MNSFDSLLRGERICASCFRRLEVLFETKRIEDVSGRILYAYNDFFKPALSVQRVRGLRIERSIFVAIPEGIENPLCRVFGDTRAVERSGRRKKRVQSRRRNRQVAGFADPAFAFQEQTIQAERAEFLRTSESEGRSVVKKRKSDRQGKDSVDGRCRDDRRNDESDDRSRKAFAPEKNPISGSCDEKRLILPHRGYRWFYRSKGGGF